jgi:outer membrane murein-binding lipoprotein Lpp
MNTDEKILKSLEDLQAGQQALRADVKTLNGKVDTVEQGQQALQDVQEQQWEHIAQQGKILAGLGATAGTILDEQQAQRVDIRSLHTGMQSLHTEVHASKEELKSEIIAARADAKMDNVDLKATVVRQLKDHEKRIDALEDATGIPHPDKN